MSNRLMDFSPQMETFEYEFESGAAQSESEVFNEGEQMELAAELLEVCDEAELEQFLGSLIKKAGSALGKIVKSPVGKTIGGFLKSAAKKALPITGAALGGMVGGPIGAKIGSGLANVAGSGLGLELEGLSHEDQEFEAARQFVRFAGESVKNATAAPATANPANVARMAIQQAAQKHAPGFVSGGAKTGRWRRQGRNVLVIGIY